MTVQVLSRNPEPRIPVAVAIHLHTASDMASSMMAKAARPQSNLKTKAETHYRPSEGAGQDSCNGCLHARFDTAIAGTCELVAGEIRRPYVCDLFTSKIDVSPGARS